MSRPTWKETDPTEFKLKITITKKKKTSNNYYLHKVEDATEGGPSYDFIGEINQHSWLVFNSVHHTLLPLLQTHLQLSQGQANTGFN